MLVNVQNVGGMTSIKGGKVMTELQKITEEIDKCDGFLVLVTTRKGDKLTHHHIISSFFDDDVKLSIEKMVQLVYLSLNKSANRKTRRKLGL